MRSYTARWATSAAAANAIRELWNEAADLAINPILIGNGFTLPAGALIDPAFANLSAEEIYARLLRRRSEGASAAEASAAADECWRGNGYRSAGDTRRCAVQSEV